MRDRRSISCHAITPLSRSCVHVCVGPISRADKHMWDTKSKREEDARKRERRPTLLSHDDERRTTASGHERWQQSVSPPPPTCCACVSLLRIVLCSPFFPPVERVTSSPSDQPDTRQGECETGERMRFGRENRHQMD